MAFELLVMIAVDAEDCLGLARDGVAQVAAGDGADRDVPFLGAFPNEAGDDLVGVGAARWMSPPEWPPSRPLTLTFI